MQRRKTQTVLRIQPVIWKLTPRLDVARHQQARNIDAADAAAHIISGQNRLTKELLTSADFDGRLGFGRPSRRDEPHFVLLKKIHFFAFIAGKHIVEQLLALRAERGEVCVKFMPHGFILLRRTGKAAYPARLLDRIKRGEVAKFHGQTAGCPAHFCRRLHDDGIALVELSKRQFAIEIERDQEVFASPCDCRCLRHGRKIARNDQNCIALIHQKTAGSVDAEERHHGLAAESKGLRQARFCILEGAGGGVRGRLLLACLPETFQHPGRQPGLLETETRRESGAGSAGESNIAEKWLAGRPDLGARSCKTRGSVRASHQGRVNDGMKPMNCRKGTHGTQKEEESSPRPSPSRRGCLFLRFFAANLGTYGQ